jgi:nucleoside-diphosphate-sugar epimerase
VSERVLVVGGTGPTGVHIVNRFLADGAEVTIVHSGAHEAKFDGPEGDTVEHIHGDARDREAIPRLLGDREWDIAVCTSGRLRSLADHLAGKTRRLVGITGQPVYAGSVQPTPTGVLPLPVPEHAPRQRDASNYTGRVAAGEDQLFEQHGRGDFEAVIVRYPGIFGPRAPLSHEWAVVKRIVDDRPFMLLPHDGVTVFQRCAARNAAHLVYLCARRPEAAGEAFNCGDEAVLSARRVAEVICDELDSSIELVGVPAELCRGVYPLAEKSSIVLDMSKARALLGYRDVVPVEQATREAARYLFEHPPREEDLGGGAHGVFDYEREDHILEAWQAAIGAAREALDV